MMIPISGTLSKAWLSRTLGVSFDRDYYFDPDIRYYIDLQCNEYAANHFPDLNLYYSESNIGEKDYISNDQVIIGGIQPNLILGMLCGADFIPYDNRDADIASTLKLDKSADLPDPSGLLNHDLIRLFDQQIAQLRNQASYSVIPPFFWDHSGRVVIHGGLTTAQKLFGEQVFMDLLSNPERISAILQWICSCYIVLAKHFSEIGHHPIKSVHIGECAGCMISSTLYDQYVVPFCRQISNQLGPIRLHSCGNSDHLLKAMAKIPNIKALDLGGETRLDHVREIFGNEIPIDLSPLSTDMSSSSASAIVNWTQRIVEENQNGPLRIRFHLEAEYNLDSIYIMQDYLSILQK
jgi:hypothetical protein